jgi:hypothetical protein
MTTTIPDWCLERYSSASAHDRDSGILSDVALLSFLVRYARFSPPLSLPQPLPRLGLLEFPPKMLRRFPRGCVVATAHGLVTAPASVCDAARTKIIWRNRVLARVMRGFVVMPLQAAAAARIAGKSGVIAAAVSGDVADVLSFLIADANCVNDCDV